MALIGYARAGSAGPSLEDQGALLREAGALKVFAETVSVKAQERPELAKAIEALKAGDVLIVTRLDRAASSVRDLHRLVGEIAAKGASLKAAEQAVFHTDPEIRQTVRGVLAALAQFEVDLRKERHKEGIAAAKEAGRYQGGKRKVDPAAIKAAVEGGEKPLHLAKRLKISRSSVYRALDEAAGRSS